mmetsp:Transcript_14675/g.22728  ORF Transcript_14675/g.22728 Transcript_14675/m.22728 type:complete len:102 (-) Transcript_14675:64-369(-)
MILSRPLRDRETKDMDIDSVLDKFQLQNTTSFIVANISRTFVLFKHVSAGYIWLKRNSDKQCILLFIGATMPWILIRLYKSFQGMSAIPMTATLTSMELPK